MNRPKVGKETQRLNNFLDFLESTTDAIVNDSKKLEDGKVKRQMASEQNRGRKPGVFAKNYSSDSSESNCESDNDENSENNSDSDNDKSSENNSDGDNDVHDFNAKYVDDLDDSSNSNFKIVVVKTYAVAPKTDKIVDNPEHQKNSPYAINYPAEKKECIRERLLYSYHKYGHYSACSNEFWKKFCWLIGFLILIYFVYAYVNSKNYNDKPPAGAPVIPTPQHDLQFMIEPDENIKWLRPHEIVKDPQFMIDGSMRFEAIQGELGDCWVVVPMSVLPMYPDLLSHVVPKNQSFSTNYTGYFHFNFWQYGKWVEVVVDDRLPTRNRKLIYMQHGANNEFAGPLCEKAYATLYGSYPALEGGTIGEALQDFTVRNPWGNEKEWKGRYSDHSKEWNQTSEKTKNYLKPEKKEDGEFWMLFDDAYDHFDTIEICYPSPAAIFGIEESSKWDQEEFHSKWNRNESSAGGSRKYIDTFSKNPQFLVSITANQSFVDSEGNFLFLVELVQKHRRKQGLPNLPLKIEIYHIGSSKSEKQTVEFFKENEPIPEISSKKTQFYSRREVTAEYRLPPGKYLIVPSTEEPDQDCEFYLRMFSTGALEAAQVQ